ncbi:unnamed protein product [Paramecium sonneborni]|uniref:RING-type domain-containing protein n=1 Tax=Paramecium sonneborni TaxID=65129 RepID=A0A8S1Q1A6_9CILI|nr:unnamed protein product [Paramecium sonneborni]
MLSTSLIPDSIKSQHSELEKQQYWQNLGNDQNIALFCSIIHYFLNQKNYKPIQKFLNINDKDLKEDFRQIHQLIIQSLEVRNPIQQVFDSLSQNKKNIIQIGQFLDELCKIHLLKRYNKPNLKDLAIFLQIKIIFLHNSEKYGSGKDEILLIQNLDNIYFIVPSPQLQNIPQSLCNTCNQTQNCLKINCQHDVCLNCIQTSKKKIQEDFFECSCGQIVLKNNFLEDAIQEIKNIQQINEYIQLIKEYYENITEEDQMIRELEILKNLTTIKQQKYIEHKEIKNTENQNIQNQNEFYISPEIRKQSNQKNNQQELSMKSIEHYAKQFILIYNSNVQTIQHHFFSSYESRDDLNLNRQVKQYTRSQKALDYFQEEKSQPFDLIKGIENQNLEQSQQFKEQGYTFQRCTYCQCPFDNFNIKQDIGCQQHAVGVCCLYTNYRECPQCEKTNEKLKFQKINQLQAKQYQNYVSEKICISNSIHMNYGHYPSQRQDNQMRPQPQSSHLNPKLLQQQSKINYEKNLRILRAEGNNNNLEAMQKQLNYQQKYYYEHNQRILFQDGNCIEDFRNNIYLQNKQNYHLQEHKKLQ